MKPLHITVTLIAATALVGLGAWLGPRRSAPPPAIATERAPIRTAPAPFAQDDFDDTAMRREIASAIREAPPPAATEEDAPPPPSDEQRAAADRGHALVEQVIERGRLGDDDALALRAQLLAMTADDALAVRQQIAQAINADRLALDDPRALP